MNKRNHPLYNTWYNMMKRCYNPKNSNYKYYGAKGVKVDERWHDFWNFVEDIDNKMPNNFLLYSKEYQLDKDLGGGNIYSLENCRVIPAKLNNKLSNQKRQRKVLAYNDTEKLEFSSVKDVSDQLGISRRSVQLGIKNDWQSRTGYKFKYLT